MISEVKTDREKQIRERKRKGKGEKLRGFSYLPILCAMAIILFITLMPINNWERENKLQDTETD